MRRWPLSRTVLALLLLAPLLGLGLTRVGHDEIPPRVLVSAPDRAPTGEQLQVQLSADETVRYRVRYGEVELEETSRKLLLVLLTEPGTVPLEVEAVDAAGNRTESSTPISGLPPPPLEVLAPRQVLPGDPLVFRLAWFGSEVVVEDVDVRVGGRPLQVFRQSFEATAFGGVPLGDPVGRIMAEIRLRDEFGRQVVRTVELEVLADGRPLVELDLPPATLALLTPEAQAMEAAALETAMAAPRALPVWGQPFMLPVEGVASSGFGVLRRYGPDGPVSYHLGADLAAAEGTPIRAANDGTVLVAGFFPIKGGLTVLDHGGAVTSLYFHQSELLVEVGQQVRRGELIGRVGSTGLSTGPHLHWEMRLSGVPTNPLAWVGERFPGTAAATLPPGRP